jgi:NAD+ kinase
MQVGIVARRDDPRAASLAADVRDALRADGVTVAVDEATADALGVAGRPADALADCALVVSIGGDGTFLYTARNVGTTPIMGVNLGEVGFLTVTPPEEAIETVHRAVDRLRETDAPAFQRLPRVRADGDGVDLTALNEVTVLGDRGHGRGIDAEVLVDGERYTGGHADGVLVATPAGSTAYNLSEGGPLLHPSVEGFVVTGMCAAGPMPPLVVAPDAVVTVRVTAAPASAVVVGDGRRHHTIEPPTSVRIRRAQDPVRVAGPPLDLFAALSKLG